MRIGLFIKNKVINENEELAIKNTILSFGHELDDDQPDLVISIGGDGTFLKAVQKYIDRIDEVMFLCLNKGKLAFFSDFYVEDLEDVLKDDSLSNVVRFRLLETEVDGDKIYAVNEIRIENPFHTLISDVYVNSDFLENFRGNGLVVSSSLGSSAYNKSLGGALIDTSLELIQLTEVAPINNYLFSSLHSPLVVPSDSSITFKGDFRNIVLGYDHLVKSNPYVNEIKISLSNKYVSLIWKKDHNHIKRLNESFIKGR